MAERIDDTLLYERKNFDGVRRAKDRLHMAYMAYQRLEPFRKMRAKCKAFAYGQQYQQQTITYNGRTMTKEQYLQERGIPALQTNILGKIKRVVQGQFRANDSAPVCNAIDPNEKKYADILTELLRKNLDLNNRSEIDARNFEEFLIGGLPVYKCIWGYRNGKLDVFTDYVNPNVVFFPFDLDFNLSNIRFCGMLHDLDFSDVLAKFSHSDADDQRLKEIYERCMSDEYLATTYSTDQRISRIEDTSFYAPTEYGKCRVIEMWTKERRKAWFCLDPHEGNPYFIPYNDRASIDAENEKRRALNVKRYPDGTPMLGDDGQPLLFIPADKFEQENIITYERRIETYWYYRYMSPDGYILEEGVSPYWSGAESFHPFIFKPYPYIDGEFHPFISEMIPSQEYFNYYMVALDFYIRNAAKGVLMLDEASLSDNMSVEDIADQYVRSNGIILYTSKRGGNMPTTSTASTIPGGFDYILQLSRSMVDDVSGVQPALQGKGQGSESGVLYQAKATQASYSILDLMNSYYDFLKRTDYKVVKIMQGHYSGRKSIEIAGQIIPYNMDTMSDVETDITISQGVNSPVVRELSNQMLLNMVAQGALTYRQALEAGNFPNSAKILSVLDKYENQLQQQQQQMQGGAAMQQQQQPGGQPSAPQLAGGAANPLQM
jgi:hypothetical protein